MKYEAITKVKRNQQIIKYHKDNPHESLEEVGKVFGVTKQRVHQIIARGH